MGYIIADSVNKIFAEHKPLPREVTISTNIKITSVEKKVMAIGEEKKPCIIFNFTFITLYGESGSKIEIEGSIVYFGDKKELDEIEKAWKEKQILPNEAVALVINNRVLEIGLLQSIALSSQLKLPTPIKLPKFVLDTEAKETK